MEIRMNWAIALILLISITASAQRFGPTGLAPVDFRGVFNPTVGLGAAYRLEKGDNPLRAEEEVTIVGSETVDGKQGYWIEFAPLSNGPHYIKMLVLVDGNNLLTKRMITQSDDKPPVELPLPDTPKTTSFKSPFVTPADNRETADKVGTETVTTPAGTFDCDHYRAKDGSWEEWLSPQVGPWGLVKTASRIGTMTLTRIVTNATDHIAGSPKTTDDKR
jgi:hypothetical protein